MNWNEISTVLLDMDGTLLDLHFDSHFWQTYVPEHYALTRGLDVETSHKILGPIFKKHEGTLNWYCLDFWSKELDIDVAELKKDVAHLIAIKEGALEFLAQLRKHNIRTVLVTNAHPDSLALKLEHTRLDNHLDRLISAHELGLPKEEVLFWKALQTAEPYTPHQTLLIDDNLHALHSAKEFGIKHLLAACHPDSQRPPKETDEFISFHTFGELLQSLDEGRY
ncbi:GMP/IMP nucleotidase [Pseudomonadota bacterium]